MAGLDFTKMFRKIKLSKTQKQNAAIILWLQLLQYIWAFSFILRLM